MSSSENEKPRVAYIWSQELQDVSDDLPSNIGRSSMVHGLIKALDLLQEPRDGDQEDINEDGNASKENGGPRKATIISPDESLGTKECLLRYHDEEYIDALMNPRSTSPPKYDPTAPRDRQPCRTTSSSSSDYSDEEDDDERPTKRIRTEGTNHQEHDKHNLSHDNPIFPILPKYISLIASSTSTACKLLLDNQFDFVVCWDGGRHHAKKNEAGGFCYVNDLVLGLLLLSREGKIPLKPEEIDRMKNKRIKTRQPRILYLDMDLHYSDGVSSAFHSTKQYPISNSDCDGDTASTKRNIPKPPSVMTFSIHHSSTGFYPPSTIWSELTNPSFFTPFSLSVPLKPYPSPRTYKIIWEGCVEPIVKSWDPDFVVLQMGSDGLSGDRVGQFGNWSVEGEGGMKWCIDRVKKWNKKTCITGGGGYNHPNTARAWAAITASLLDREVNNETPIPHHEHFDEYAHSFTMEVPQGHMEDQNDSEYLKKACDNFEHLSKRIGSIVAASFT